MVAVTGIHRGQRKRGNSEKRVHDRYLQVPLIVVAGFLEKP
jgi:hypothetical protein